MKVEGVTLTPAVQSTQGIDRQDKPRNETNLDKNTKMETNIESNLVEKRKVTEKEIIDAIEKANKSVKVYDRRLEFSIHEKTKEIMVKVIDTSTDEVIREIPREKILDMVAKMWELAGILIDEKV